MTIFVFGNPDIKKDSLPLRLLPLLKRRFPDVKFRVLDPNEEWDAPPKESFTAIDTAINAKRVEVFENIEQFASPPRLTMHDFDALTEIKYLVKLGKIKSVRIICLPPDMPASEALEELTEAIDNLPIT